MITHSKSNRWKSARLARLKWSKNAGDKRERNRIERATSLIEELPAFKLPNLPRLKADLKVVLERRDGGRIQFTLHHIYGKLVGGSVNMTPKQFGRRLGEIFNLWCMA
jgi:hypothetical protein